MNDPPSETRQSALMHCSCAAPSCSSIATCHRETLHIRFCLRRMTLQHVSCTDIANSKSTCSREPICTVAAHWVERPFMSICLHRKVNRCEYNVTPVMQKHRKQFLPAAPQKTPLLELLRLLLPRRVVREAVCELKNSKKPKGFS